MTPDNTPQIIVSLLALGMSLAFIVADRASPISRTLAAFLACIGISIGIGTMFALPMHIENRVPVWGGVFALPEMFAFIFAFEWLLRVRRTIPAGRLQTRFADRLLRVAQGLAVFYGIASLALPKMRSEHFINLMRDANESFHPSFYLFAVPLAVSLLLGTVSGLLMLNRRPDRAEALRGVAFLVGAPFMASGLILPLHLAPVVTAIGLLIFLVGAVQYHVTQGRRAQFMARFLSPQVAKLVSERGLKSATDEQTLEISVVCCDLRGFTAFSAATSSKKVIQILREYYDAVGAAAAAFGGTIKDQAGDGVLILVGAPIAFADHAPRALEMARQIRSSGVAVTERWSDADLHLGVGVGVGSGFVTVGVIGAASRLEYTAVGPAVNLAARLCAESMHGEILVDQRTTDLLQAEPRRVALTPGEALKLKGFQLPVQSYVLAPG
ncbi:MAG: adenylate/guanylate cyclase domain-containing protein [Betaproteobacteria bacterium]|nr:adenylate/guanylate cyclase domain-containing protein [Betaproteobacteria bacterium]